MHTSLFTWVLIIYLVSAIPCWILFAKKVWWLAFYPALNTYAVLAFFWVYISGTIKRRRDSRNWNKRHWANFSKRPDFPLKGQKL